MILECVSQCQKWKNNIQKINFPENKQDKQTIFTTICKTFLWFDHHVILVSTLSTVSHEGRSKHPLRINHFLRHHLMLKCHTVPACSILILQKALTKLPMWWDSYKIKWKALSDTWSSRLYYQHLLGNNTCIFRWNLCLYLQCHACSLQ